MKVKSLEKINSIVIVFSILLLLIHSVMFIYTTEGISYFDLWLVLQSTGLTLFLIVCMSASFIQSPSNFYKTNGDSFLFYNNNIDVLIKLIGFIFSILLISFGTYLEPANAVIDSWRTNSWFSIIVSFIFILGFFISFIQFLVAWWNNKNDKITLDANHIHFFDTERGEKKIDLKTIKEIEFSDESILFKGTENVTIDLSEMSLQVFKDKIEEELIRFCPDIKITTISDE